MGAFDWLGSANSAVDDWVQRNINHPLNNVINWTPLGIGGPEGGFAEKNRQFTRKIKGQGAPGLGDPKSGEELAHQLRLGDPSISLEDRNALAAQYEKIKKIQGIDAAKAWAKPLVSQAITSSAPQVGGKSDATLGTTINDLASQLYPAPEPMSPQDYATLMNAQQKFMAPYMQDLTSNSTPGVRAAYAQQMMSFPLAYQIQQQMDRANNMNDLHEQIANSIAGTYFKNQMTPSTSGAGLSGLSGQSITPGAATPLYQQGP